MIFWIKKFLSNLYISAVFKDKECQIYAKVIKDNKILKTLEAVFDLNENKALDTKFNDYIKKQEKISNFAYLSVMINTSRQWALPTTTKEGYTKFGIDFSSVNIVVMPGDWSIFIYKDEIENLQNLFNGIEINLIYSPFALLYENIINIKNENKNVLYIYNHENSISMMVFDQNTMKFSSFFSTIKSDDGIDEYKELSSVDTSDLENVISKEDDKFDQLDSLEDINFIENSSDREIFEDMNADFANIKNLEESVDDISKETILMNYIRLSIEEYYKNDLYDSHFIDKILIFDDTKLEKSFLSLLESELLIETSIVEIDTLKDLNKLMIRELRI